MKLLLDVLEVLERFVLRRRSSALQRDEQHRGAVESLLAAVLATETYVFENQHQGSSSRRKEGELAALWSRAAVDVRAVDGRLSRIALLTSFTWANPDLLRDEKFKEVPDSLATLREQCEWLLEHWSSQRWSPGSRSR